MKINFWVAQLKVFWVKIEEFKDYYHFWVKIEALIRCALKTFFVLV